MAHELEIINGEAQMMYVQDKPWHGLGKKLDNAPTIQEGIVHAGLDWDVELRDLYTNELDIMNGVEIPLSVESHKAVVRNTDNSVLGVVGNRYHTLQNKEAFKWFEPFIEEGHVTLESAGSLQGGRKVWVLAKVNSDIVIKGEDTIEQYILLSNSHDGSMSIKAGFTPIRVVCNNTLSAATTKGSNLLSVRHTQSAKMTLEVIRDTMNVINQTFEASVEQYKYLANHNVSKQQVEKLVKTVFKFNEKDPSSRSINQLDKVMWLWENGTGNDMDGVRGTAWTAYNAITEYLSREVGSSLDKRYASLWFGGNAKRNDIALQETLKIAA